MSLVKNLVRKTLNLVGVKDVNYTVKHRLLRQSYAWSDFPQGIQLDLDNSCNLFCCYCRPQRDIRRGIKKSAQMSDEVLDWVLRDVARFGRGTVTYFADFLDGDGLNASLPEKRRHIKKMVPWVPLETYTNGSRPENAYLLCDKSLDRIGLTFSAVNHEQYKLVHGADRFDEVVKTVRYLCDHHLPNQILNINFVINKYNIGSIREWIDMVQVNFPGWVPLISPLVVTGDDCESNKAIGSYSTLDQELAIVKAGGEAFWNRGDIRGRQPCVLWHNDSITAAGDLLQCCRWDKMDWSYGKAQDFIKNGWGFRDYHMMKVLNRLRNPFCDRCNLKCADWRKRQDAIDVRGVVSV